jgi:hypothetical protein
MPKCGRHRCAKEIGRSARRVLINGQKAATVGCSKSDPTPTNGQVGSGSQMTRSQPSHRGPHSLNLGNCGKSRGTIEPRLLPSASSAPPRSTATARLRHRFRSSRHSRASTWRHPPSNSSFCLAQAASRIGKQFSFTVPIRRMVVMTQIASSGRPARREAGAEYSTTRGESADDQSVLQ